MASTTVKPYPHVQINVKDNSIATVQIVETVPVHRPLYVMRTQEGRVGVPVWCNTYSEAVAEYGAETFNQANPTYFSRAAQFLLNTFTYNGAFICRYVPEDATTASYALFAHVYTEDAIPQYEYANGARVLTFVDGEWVYKQKTGEGATEPGIKVCFGVRALRTDAYGNPIEFLDDLKAQFVAGPDGGTGYYEFPLFAFSAKYAGAYGNDLAFRLFYNGKDNQPADIDSYGTVFYKIGFARRDYNSSTAIDVTDIYAAPCTTFAANPDAINPDSGASLDVATVLDKGFSDRTHILPVDLYPYESSFNAIGLIIAAFEKDVKDADGNVTIDSLNGHGIPPYAPIGALTEEEKAAVKKVYITLDATDDEKKLVAGLTLGYKVNSVSLVDCNGNLYDHAIIGTTDVDLAGVSLTDTSYLYLDGGSDGTFIADDANVDEEGNALWATDDKAMYDFCKLQLPGVKDTILESLHYPFTHIFDIGYSIKTKKAILDMLDKRDDFMAILSTQVLMSDGSGRSVATTFEALNTQAADEANAETLRSYALLMRESVLYGTDCMRASIYCHAGILAEGSFTKPVPFTYWDALQYAQYGNLTYMKQAEPRGLPNSYNLLFKKWNWNNYRADAQSRVWDGGANYVQYADMTRLFYPALRTVYRASTSVLVDEWFVAAVVYAKYECKRAWAQFSGRNDPAAVLQGAIKQYLDGKLAQLFNGKYTFVVSVYQTADEQEIGYIQHVKLSITSPATMRVLDVDIEVNREGFTAEE